MALADDEVRIRTATGADTPAILALWNRARSEIASLPDDPRSLEQLLALDDKALLVADASGNLVGALIAAWDGWRGNMYRLAVLPERRREGIGLRLVEAGHDLLREKGARRVTALVGVDEEAAAELWLAAGYERDPRVFRFVRNL